MTLQRPIGRLGILYSVEASSDLATWSTAVQVGAPVPNGDGTETLTFRDTIPVAEAPGRFLRLKVTTL